MADSPRPRRNRTPPRGLGPIARENKARSQGARFVSSQEIREIYGKAGIQQNIDNDLYKVIVETSNHPSPPLAQEPLCTLSQILTVFDAQGKKIASVHRYLRTDGTVGASGKLDPKEVLFQNVWYIVQKYS